MDKTRNLRNLLACVAILGVASAIPAAELLYTVNDPKPASGDGFGKALAIFGNYLVVGAAGDDTVATNAGAAYLFGFNSVTGNLLHTLNNPNPANPSAFADDNFGGSVGMSGNYIVVGAPGEDIGATILQAAVGKAYVFDAVSGATVQTFDNPAPNFGDQFGTSVAISGTKALIGTPYDDAGATDAGVAYLYNVTTGALLRTFGNPTPASSDIFGKAVAIDGNFVAIGAPSDNTGANDAGAAYLFDVTTGGLLQPFTNPNPMAGDGFGNSLAVNGNLILIGAPEVDRPDVGNSVQVGAAYLFDATTGGLLHTFVNPDPRDEVGSASNGERFGSYVAINGSKILIGTPGDDNGRGAAYLFDAATGALLDTYYDPTPLGLEGFAGSVAVSDSMVMAGPSDAGVRVFEAASPVLLGDFNSDGAVNAADYVVWRNGLGTIYTQTDYSVWRSHFGATAGSGSGAGVAVPEPATFALAVLALVCLAGRTLGNSATFGTPESPRFPRWARTTTLGLFVLGALASPASAIRNGTLETGVPYNGVGMILPTAGHPLSTGTMVSQFVFLTAAQNVRDLSPDPAIYEFTLGPGTTAHATEIRQHPDFETIDGINLAYDIALVALDHNEVRSWPGFTRSTIRDKLVPVGALATGVGFGEFGAGIIGEKRSGSFLVNGYLSGADEFGSPIGDAFIEVVPGNPQNQCFCQGDQGGPLYFENKIVGVASFRFVATCPEVGPGYYVSLHRLTDWILNNLNEMDPPIPGDYNGNGKVGPEDYSLWRANFGTSNHAADGNGNGIVDAADYTIWRDHVGQISGSGAGASTNATAPEPTTLALLMCAASGWCRRRSRTAFPVSKLINA